MFVQNKDGFVDRDELGNACKLSGYSMADDFLDALLSDCDEDKDGKLSFLEFCNFLCYKDSMKINDKSIISKSISNFNFFNIFILFFLSGLQKQKKQMKRC